MPEGTLQEYKNALNEYNVAFDVLKGLKEQADKDSAQVKSWLEKLDGLDTEKLKKAQAKMDELELSLQRPSNPSDQGINDRVIGKAWDGFFGHIERKSGERLTNNAENRKLAQDVWEKYCRKGEHTLHVDEQKLLSTMDQSAGGYLVIPEFEASIIKELADISSIRQDARVRKTATGMFQIPRRKTRVSGGWVGEAESTDPSNSTYGLETIPNGTIRAVSEITNNELQDSAFDMEGEIRADMMEEFDAISSDGYVMGTGGSLKPEGIFKSSLVTQVVQGDSGTLVTYQGLVRLRYGTAGQAINRQFTRNFKFAMNLATLGAVRLLEDGAGNLIFAAPTQGAPGTILGELYSIYPEAPDVAADALPILGGDIRAAYTIMDRLGMTMIRNPYSKDSEGIVRFTGYLRTGGQVVQAAAIRYLKIATS